MSSTHDNKTTSALLFRALHRIRTTPPRVIASPPTQPRRAAVALILRVVPPPHFPLPQVSPTPPSLADFFAFDWVAHPAACPEILFLHRSKPQTDDTQDAHVAFPGGRMEEGDEGGLYTAMRQTWEEIGLDLAESHYMAIGQLDDREITTSLGKRLLMILSPFVFLQLTPTQTAIEPAPETTLHWIPLTSLFTSPPSQLSPEVPQPLWSTVTVDAATRLAPRNSTVLRIVMRTLVGNMQFPALILPTSSTFLSVSSDQKPRRSLEMEAGIFYRSPSSLKLWGLTLGMTLDLLSFMAPTPLTPWDADAVMGITGVSTDERGGKGKKRRKGKGRINAPPSLTSVFPRFSYPDVNFWIWVFGRRYREVIRGWEASVRAGGTNDRRINWTGAALTTFYAAVRKALIVVLVLRAVGILVGVAFGLWWVFR